MASTQVNPVQSKGLHTARQPNFLEEPNDFSLVLGGPVFQLFRKSHLAGDGLELVHRRLLIITLVAWLPLLLITILSSSPVSLGKLSFLHDVEVHVRFLIALPVLIVAELLVHSRIRPVVRAFVERRIVLPEDLPRFHSAIESAVRLRNSVRVEIGIGLVRDDRRKQVQAKAHLAAEERVLDALVGTTASP